MSGSSPSCLAHVSFADCAHPSAPSPCERLSRSPSTMSRSDSPVAIGGPRLSSWIEPTCGVERTRFPFRLQHNSVSRFPLRASIAACLAFRSPAVQEPWGLPSSWRFSPCMPCPEDPGGLPRSHRANDRFAWASRTVTRSPPASELLSFSFEAVPNLGGLRPLTAYMVPCVRFKSSVRLPSSGPATLGTGGWLAPTRRGLPPRKKRQASLGAQRIKAQRRAAFGASAAALGWAPWCRCLARGQPRIRQTPRT